MNLLSARGEWLAQTLPAAPPQLWQDTAVSAAAAAADDAAGCLVTVSMEPAPIVMVMGHWERDPVREGEQKYQYICSVLDELWYYPGWWFW